MIISFFLLSQHFLYLHVKQLRITAPEYITPCKVLIFNIVALSHMDVWRISVNETILRFQSPTSGLFPLDTTDDCEVADVRHSIYCALSIWSLHLSYRKILSGDGGRTHLLSQTAVKTMRGILTSWMHQIPKVNLELKLLI